MADIEQESKEEFYLLTLKAPASEKDFSKWYFAEQLQPLSIELSKHDIEVTRAKFGEGMVVVVSGTEENIDKVRPLIKDAGASIARKTATAVEEAKNGGSASKGVGGWTPGKR